MLVVEKDLGGRHRFFQSLIKLQMSFNDECLRSYPVHPLHELLSNLFEVLVILLLDESDGNYIGPTC